MTKLVGRLNSKLVFRQNLLCGSSQKSIFTVATKRVWGQLQAMTQPELMASGGSPFLCSGGIISKKGHSQCLWSQSVHLSSQPNVLSVFGCSLALPPSTLPFSALDLNTAAGQVGIQGESACSLALSLFLAYLSLDLWTQKLQIQNWSADSSAGLAFFLEINLVVTNFRLQPHSLLPSVIH